MAKLKRYDTGNDIHYKRMVSAAGDKKDIIASEDIYSESGQKLVAKGIKIDNKVIANLIKHKLHSPLDNLLEISTPVSATSLVADIKIIIASSKTLSKLYDTLSGCESIEALIAPHQFPPAIAFKLSIAKSERDDIYSHSLVILCLCYFIACKAKVSHQTLSDTLLAALFHDLGLLHIDPSYFEADRKLQNEERKFLNVHVIISNLIIQPYGQYKGTISRAVLDHHERLDGSGYPNAKFADEICLSGQILSIAEVVSSKFDQYYECINPQQLELLLQMNNKKLDPKLCSYLSILYRDVEPNSNDVLLADSEVITKLHQLAKILKRWHSFASKQSFSASTDFINHYINTLNDSLIQAGMNFANLDCLIDMLKQDEQMKQHTFALIKESSWQLNNLIDELQRRKLYQSAIVDNSQQQWLSAIERFIID